MSALNQRLEEILNNAQVERVGTLRGLTDPSNVVTSPDGSLLSADLLTTERLISCHKDSPRDIISGNCRTIASGVAGVLLADGLIDNPRIFVEIEIGHFILLAVDLDTGSEIVIDMGGQQALPLAVPTDGKPVSTFFYANKRSLFSSNVLTATATHSVGCVSLRVEDSANNHVSNRFYMDEEHCNLSVPVWGGLSRGLAPYIWRYAFCGEERVREQFSVLDQAVFKKRKAAEIPFELRVVNDASYGQLLRVPVSEQQMDHAMRAAHAVDDSYHVQRGDPSIPYERLPPTRAFQYRKSVLWIASGLADSPKRHHELYLASKLVRGWSFAAERDDLTRHGPYVTDWDDPRLPSDVHERNQRSFECIRASLGRPI